MHKKPQNKTHPNPLPLGSGFFVCTKIRARSGDSISLSNVADLPFSFLLPTKITFPDTGIHFLFILIKGKAL